MDAVKQFFSYGNMVTMYQIEDQVGIVNQLMQGLSEMAKSFISIAQCLVDDSQTCLFHLITSISSQTNSICGMDILDILDSIIEKVNHTEKFTEQMLGIKFKVDRQMMEEGYHRLLTGESVKDDNSEEEKTFSREDAEKALTEFRDSFDKILEYAGFESDKAEEMKAAMEAFVNLKEKTSTDDGPRKIRRKVTENH
jgi:hypothetical protein